MGNGTGIDYAVVFDTPANIEKNVVSILRNEYKNAFKRLPQPLWDRQLVTAAAGIPDNGNIQFLSEPKTGAKTLWFTNLTSSNSLAKGNFHIAKGFNIWLNPYPTPADALLFASTHSYLTLNINSYEQMVVPFDEVPFGHGFVEESATVAQGGFALFGQWRFNDQVLLSIEQREQIWNLHFETGIAALALSQNYYLSFELNGDIIKTTQ